MRNLYMPDSGSKVNGLGQHFSLGGFTVSYSTFHQMREVISEKDGVEVSYRWFRKREIAEAFTINKLAKGAQMNTKAIEENGKAVAEMVNLLRAKVI